MIIGNGKKCTGTYVDVEYEITTWLPSEFVFTLRFGGNNK